VGVVDPAAGIGIHPCLDPAHCHAAPERPTLAMPIRGARVAGCLRAIGPR